MGHSGVATILFGIFTLARLAHSMAYLRRMRPWRTVSFVVGGLATIALMLDIVWLIVRAGLSIRSGGFAFASAELERRGTIFDRT